MHILAYWHFPIFRSKISDHFPVRKLMLVVRFRIFPLLSIGMNLWLLTKIFHENCSAFTLIFCYIFCYFDGNNRNLSKLRILGYSFFPPSTSMDMYHGPNFEKKWFLVLNPPKMQIFFS